MGVMLGPTPATAAAAGEAATAVEAAVAMVAPGADMEAILAHGG